MTANDNELVVGRISGSDIEGISLSKEEEGLWQIWLRCDHAVDVPFVVLDGDTKEAVIDLDDAVVRCEAAVFEGSRVCPKYAECVVRECISV